MPRCVHLIPDTHAAGAENQALNVLRGLRDRGFELEVVYFEEGRLHESFEQLGVPLRRIPRRRRLSLDWWRRSRGLRALYEGNPPDILHSWLFEGNAIAVIAARRLPGTRVVVAQRSGTMEREAPLRMRAMRAIFARADFAISNSREGADLLRDLGVPPERFGISPQGVAPEKIAVMRDRNEVRRELGIAESDELVVAVGRADDTKDFPMLFEAFRRARAERPSLRLALVGPTAAEMEALGAPVPEGAAATGWLERPAEVLNAADAVAISSWTEGHSNVADEALMLGAPVATTDSGDHPAVVARCGGRVVPIREPDALARAILELIDDPPARDAVRAAARAELSLDRTVEYTVGVYERLLNGR